jgi:hypothetical protein
MKAPAHRPPPRARPQPTDQLTGERWGRACCSLNAAEEASSRRCDPAGVNDKAACSREDECGVKTSDLATHGLPVSDAAGLRILDEANSAVKVAAVHAVSIVSVEAHDTVSVLGRSTTRAVACFGPAASGQRP